MSWHYGIYVLPAPELITAIQSYWIGGARSGVPGATGQPTWTPYDLKIDENIQLASPISFQRGLARDECDLWNEVLVAQ